MRERFSRRAIPGKGFRETPRRDTKVIDQIRGLHYPPHRRRHGIWIVLRNKKARLAVDYRFADARRVGGNHGSPACGSFKIADSPPFLWRCQRRGPCAPKEVKLRLLRNETKKLHSVTETERFYQTFEPSAIVTGSSDLQSCVGHVQAGKRADDHIYSFVLLKPAEIHEQRSL